MPLYFSYIVCYNCLTKFVERKQKMKKTLSFLLCLVMLFTSVSVFGVQASADKPLLIMSAPEKAEYLKMEDADLAFYMDKALALKEEIITVLPPLSGRAPLTIFQTAVMTQTMVSHPRLQRRASVRLAARAF